MHELGHGLGIAPLIQTNPNGNDPGAWVNFLIVDDSPPVPPDPPDPPAVLPFGDIYSRFLTRTPAGGGPNDKDFFDMTDAERLAAATSNEVYFTGANVKAAEEFTPPPAPPLTSFKGEIQILARSPFTGLSLLSHFEQNHAGDILLKPVIPMGIRLRDVDATRELMLDLGWSLTAPPAAGSLATVYADFDFTGEEFGTEALPVNSMTEAVDLVMSGGTVNIAAGSSSETLTISKAMTVNALGGTVSIGAP